MRYHQDTDYRSLLPAKAMVEKTEQESQNKGQGKSFWGEKLEKMIYNRKGALRYQMDNHDQIKKWIITWKKADSALRSIRNIELRDKNYYSVNREILNNMLQYAFDHHVIRKSSGLVIQQHFFKEYYLREKNYSL